MHIREILARNLRRLCDSKGSVIKICREIPVNRQQFNRYLSAETMPHPGTLKKICTYFQVSESELLKFEETTTSTQDSGLHDLLDIPGSQEILNNLSSTSLPEINPGLYTAYIVVSRSPVEVACSTIVVRRHGNTATFRRLTNYSEPEASNWHYVRGDHLGIIIERAGWLYFMGINDKGLSEPSILAAQWLPLSPKVLSGTALVGSQAGPESLPLIIAPSPQNASLRDVLKLSHVLPLSADEISPVIRTAINRCLSSGQPSIQRHPIDHLPDERLRRV